MIVLFSEFGLAKQLHSDLGKNFESKLFHELCLLAGVNKSHTTPFHPPKRWADGKNEQDSSPDVENDGQ